jgi:hypothetical protein
MNKVMTLAVKVVTCPEDSGRPTTIVKFRCSCLWTDYFCCSKFAELKAECQRYSFSEYKTPEIYSLFFVLQVFILRTHRILNYLPGDLVVIYSLTDPV